MARAELTPQDKINQQKISATLNRLADSKQVTQSQISRITKIPTGTLNGYFKGTSLPNPGNVEKLAEFFNVLKSDIDPRYKTISNGIKIQKLVKIPVLGTIACGDPILAEQNIEGYVDEPADKLDSNNYFYLHAQGDSMETTIPNGSMVLIREQATVEDGEIAAVLVDGDTRATLKRVHYQGSSVILNADNKNYPPIIINCENPGRIIGKAIRVSIDL